MSEAKRLLWITYSGYIEAEILWHDHAGTMPVKLTITPRPSYCDRGRWLVNIYGAALDDQEGFPRYYFDLERAKAEMEAWLSVREEIKP